MHNEDIAIGKKMQIKRKKVNSLEKNFSFDVCLFFHLVVCFFICVNILFENRNADTIFKR